MKLLKFSFLIPIALIFLACSSTGETKHARIIWDKYNNGNYKIVHQYFTDTADMTEDYFYQEFYENGTLKIQGLENQRVRKGEWCVYYGNGDVKARLNFDKDKLNGPIKLYNENGAIKVKGIAKNGSLEQNNGDVLRLLLQYFDSSEKRPVWTDSLDIMMDSLRTKLNKK